MPQFTTLDQFLDPQNGHVPTDAEKKLIAACRAGERCMISDTRPETEPEGNTIRAPFLRLLITGATPACGLQDCGVDLHGGWITGTLDLDYAKARGMTTLDACQFTDTPHLMQAQLRHLSLQGSHLPGLMAQGMNVDGSVLLRNLTATGMVDVNAAQITGQLDCDGASFNGKTWPETWGRALHAQGVTVGAGLFLRNLTATGTVDVNAAQITGQLACEWAKLNGQTGADRWGDALNAQGVTVGADLILSNLNATGTVAVNGAQINGQFSCIGATFVGKTGPKSWGNALNAQGVTVGAALFLTNLTATGSVDVNGARIMGELSCEGATVDGKGGRALNGQRMQVKQGFFWRGIAKTGGQVYLASARVGDLVDDLASWPDDLYLDGFTYDRISAAPTGATERLIWLAKGSTFAGTFHPQPYTQLAKVLSEMGHDGDARRVLMERERLLAGKHWRSRLWSGTIRLIAGYGYAPQRAFYWAIVFIAASSGFYAYAYAQGALVPNSDVILTSFDWWRAMLVAPQAPTAVWNDLPSATHYETFYSLAYAFDVFVPLIDLGQESAWSATTVTPLGKVTRCFTFGLEIIGWVITALGAAAITGIIQRDRG